MKRTHPAMASMVTTSSSSPSLSAPSAYVRQNYSVQVSELSFPAPSPRRAAKEPVVHLSPSQLVAKTVVDQGHSVFCTGSAGTGKSYLLQHLIQCLRTKHNNRGVYVTATTGNAAVLIGGRTINSFAGVGLGREPVAHLLANMTHPAKKRWGLCKVLIIDEISMMNSEMFDKLEEVARLARVDYFTNVCKYTNKALAHFAERHRWGGIQLVLTGDFLQIPPVDFASGFCFQAATWCESVPFCVELKEIFRQVDPRFMRFLQEVRRGQLSSDGRSILTECSDRKLEELHGVKPALLTCHRVRAQSHNHFELSQLPDTQREFECVDTGTEPYLSILRSTCQAPETLQLKIGAHVMLIRNLDTDDGLFNGARGVVVGFRTKARSPYDDATTTTTAEDDDDDDKANHVSARYTPVDKPIVAVKVRFSTGRVHEIKQQTFNIEIDTRVEASRKQFPLILAWAITIHKCQGMSLDSVEAHLEGAFEYGQVYVALSRARTLEGLALRGVEPSTIRAHPKALEFYDKLAEQKVNPCAMTRLVSTASMTPTPIPVVSPTVIHLPFASSLPPAALTSSSSSSSSTSTSSFLVPRPVFKNPFRSKLNTPSI